MLRFFYDWMVALPANVVASLMVLFLSITPAITGVFGGWLSYTYLGPHGEPRSAKHYLALFIAFVIGFYVALVTYDAFTKVPGLIFKYLRDD